MRALESGQSVEPSVQKDILQKLENQNSVQTDLILAREFQVEIKVDEKKVTQRDESVRMELTFTKDEMAQRTINSYKPKPAREPACGRESARKREVECESAIEATNVAAADATVAVKTSQLEAASLTTEALLATKTTTAPEKPTTQKARTHLKPTPPKSVALKSVALKSVTPTLKREILRRDQFCQFEDAATGKVCGTKLFLEIDHIRPRFARDENTSENLRALCKNHNMFRYQQGL